MIDIWHEFSDVARKTFKWLSIDITIFVVLLTICAGMFHDEIGANPYRVWPWTLFSFSKHNLSTEAYCYWLFFVSIPFVAISGIIFAQIRMFQPKLYGDAKWMGRYSAKQNDLFTDNGVLLGKKWGEYLKIGGWEHVLCFAPSGSGKSTAIAIPNLLSWDESAICLDIKGELYKTTAAFREKCNHKCYLWDPGNPTGTKHCFNPLDLISKDKLARINNIQKIANLFFPDRERVEPIWSSGPRDLFLGVCLFVLDSPEYKNTLGDIARFLKEPNIDKFLQEELEENPNLDPRCIHSLSSYLSMSENTRSSIRAIFLTGLELFNNPIIDKATSTTDFNLEDLRKDKISIYVKVSNDNLTRLAPLVNLFFQLSMDVLTRKEPAPEKEPYGILFLLDEFVALGKMPLFKSTIGLLRSYRIRLLMIIQDIAQLNDLYGQEGAKIFLNVKVRLAFAQNSLDTANYLSKLMGEKTVRKTSNTAKRSLLTSSSNKTEIKVPLMMPQDILKLPEQQLLILIQGLEPLRANKVVWFRDRILKGRGV
jgi:type IV secretion system protein VirD4